MTGALTPPARHTGLMELRLGPVKNTFLFVDDLDAATRWYAARLGRDPAVRGGSLVAFDLDGGRLTIHAADEYNTPGPAGTAAYWRVDDVDAVVAEWQRHGAVAHRGPKTVFTGERLCQLLDPFGNLFCIVETAPTDGVTVDRDIRYGTVGDDSLLLDVYAPDGPVDPSRAAVVLVHGGGWFRGAKAKEPRLASMLARAGYLVFVPDYREAPAHTFPASRDDVLAAGQWALGADYAFDRDRLAFFGGSAGGNLAVEAAIATGRPAVSWSGIFDLRHIIESTESAASDPAAAPTTQDLDALKSADIDQTGPDVPFLRWTILQEVGGDRSLLEAASTTRHVVAGSGAVYLVNSMNEFVPVDDPAALQRAFAAVGVASTLQLVPGVHHAEGYTDQAIGGSLQFLADALRRD